MTITTVAGAISGLQPAIQFVKVPVGVFTSSPNSLWAATGTPPAGAYDSTLNGVVLSQTAAQVDGALYFKDPSSGNAYLGRLQTQMTSMGILMLCDRLWHNGGYTITSTGAQNSTTPTWPARDANGATSGDGVLLGLEISSGVGAATPTVTVGYTNSGGTNSRSATNLDATVSSASAGAFFRIGLQAGDKGVQSVQSLTLNASWLSGTMNLVAYRVLAELEVRTSNIGSTAIDALTAGLPRLYPGTTPFLIVRAGASSVTGSFTATNG